MKLGRRIPIEAAIFAVVQLLESRAESIKETMPHEPSCGYLRDFRHQ